MRVFVTGATGYIGSHVARALYGAGHDILALAHHEEARGILEDAGYDTVPGDLTDPKGLAAAVAGVDGAVHTANTNGEEAGEVDDAAVRAMVGALEGSGAPFVYTSGIWVLGETGEDAADERSATNPLELVAWRGPLETWLVGAADRGVRTVVIRPGIVYGDAGGIPAMLAAGDLPMVGDGQNRWPLVHVRDLARLYVNALEDAPAGSILHGISETVKQKDVGEHLGAETMPLDEAREKMGGFADALATDQHIAAPHTRELLGWEPREPGILQVREEALARSSG